MVHKTRQRQHVTEHHEPHQELVLMAGIPEGKKGMRTKEFA